MAAGIKRQCEPSRIVGDLLRAEIAEGSVDDMAIVQWRSWKRRRPGWPLPESGSE